MADWQKIKTEYITTDTSYRKLAQKYGVRYATLQARAKEEKWTDLRDQHRTSTVSKAVNAIGTKQANMAAKLYGVGGLLLDKVKSLLEDNPELLADTSAMKDVSVVLKNLKDLMSVKSEADMREQEARIEKLRKEAMVEKENNRPIEVVFAAGPEEWNE